MAPALPKADTVLIRAALDQSGAQPLAWASRHMRLRHLVHGTVPDPTITTPRERAPRWIRLPSHIAKLSAEVKNKVRT